MPIDPEEVLAELRGKAHDEEEAEEMDPSTVITMDLEDRGRRYTGRFLYTVPTLGQSIELGALKARYLPQGSASDANAALLADVIAYLTVTIRFDKKHPKPKWWDPMNARFVAPYSWLYGRCLEYEAQFLGNREDGAGDEEGDDGRDESGEHEAARQHGVGDEVQPPPKRRETLAGDGS